MAKTDTDIIHTDQAAGRMSAFDKIQQHWTSGGEYELSESLQAINRRWKMAFTLMEAEGYSDRDIAQALKSYFDISLMQGYRDVRDAKMLFGDVVSVDSRIERYFALQSAKQLLRQAMTASDTKSWIAALKLIVDIAGINSDTIESDLYKKLERHEVHINIPEEQMKILKQLTESGAIDFSTILKSAEDIPFEHVE